MGCLCSDLKKVGPGVTLSALRVVVSVNQISGTQLGGHSGAPSEESCPSQVSGANHGLLPNVLDRRLRQITIKLDKQLIP